MKEDAGAAHEWQTVDLLGCEVFTADGERLGVMTDMLPTGGNDVWVVKTGPEDYQEILIPALKTVVKEVDIAAKRITVVLPAGLKELSDELSAPRAEKPQKKKWYRRFKKPGV